MMLTGTGRPGHAWLVVGTDATIIAADEAACALLGVATSRALIGQAWTSFVLSTHGTGFGALPGGTLGEALAAVRAGHAWRGSLRFTGSTASSSLPTDVELFPTAAAGGVALMHLSAGTALVTDGGPRRPDERAVREAQVAALEALAALPEPHAASRAVLQALAGAVAFDWGAVLRFRDHQLGINDLNGAEIVAVYPAPMAGMDRGTSWALLDSAQAGVLNSGEPELARQLATETGVPSPLRRMPAFGMTSRIQVPLYDGTTVVGCLVVYAVDEPFNAADGIAIERVSRALGPHLASIPLDAIPQTLSDAETSSPPALPTPDGRTRPQVIASPRATSNIDHGSGSTAHLTALSEVVSGVAHELNNPLTAILGYAQIFHSLDDAERAHAMSTIEHEAQRAARIVRNLLSFARQEPPHTSRVDIEEVVRRVVEVMRYSLEVDNVRTELRFAGVPEVEADRSQLEQVFLNLVSNAQQALQPGGGEIIITTARVGGFVRVSVADDGPGVPEEMRDRVFEPFFTTHDVGFGPGMGLSTVYGLVTQHGGRVWVEPSPSGGANFTVELPVQLEAAPSPTAAASVPAAVAQTGRTGGTGERILVVDDELPIRALTSEILSHAGYRVTTAANGDEALRRLDTGTFDLVLTDMRMPGMNGGTLYEHICDRWPQMEGRILFITGDIEGEPTSRRLARGDVRFLEKPFDTNALLGAIREALDA